MPDIELDLGMQLIASLETVTAKLTREEDHRQRKMQAIRQIPLVAPQATASPFVIDSPDNLAAKTGYCWGVRRLALTGFSAGSATVYLNSTVGEPVAVYGTPGVLMFGRGDLILTPGDRLVVAGTGITGFIQLNGRADCFESWYLPYYID